MNPFSNTSQKGMTLLEVMIALAIFAFFMVAYISSQGGAILSSTEIKEDINLKRLARIVVNDITTNPPPFRESLTLTPETKTFEDYENYEYTLTWKKLKIPDFDKITGKEDERAREQTHQDQIQKQIFEQVIKNMEKMIWQVEVRVTNKTSGQSYDVAAWLYDDKAEVQFDSF